MKLALHVRTLNHISILGNVHEDYKDNPLAAPGLGIEMNMDFMRANSDEQFRGE